MKNRDLENFYSKINGSIKLISSYIQHPIFIKIIKACRLKPYSAFDKNYKLKTAFEKHWVDEFGNSLTLNGKHFDILLNDPNICDNTNISTDLFFGRSIEETIKDGKFILIIAGEKECVLAVIRNDDYLNAYLFKNKWFKISPLFLGMRTLNQLFKNINKPHIIEINDKNIDMKFDFVVEKAIITKLQPFGNINEFLQKDYLKGLLK